MQVSGINNSFKINNYGTSAFEINNSKSRADLATVNNASRQIDQSNKNVNMLTNILEKKANDFQVVGNILKTPDKELDDLKNLINKISALRENLNIDNLGQALEELKSLGNDNYASHQQLLKMQELRENEQTAVVRSYMFSLYEKAYEKKIQSLGIDVYF
jgi:hypothetical protein